MESDDSLIRCEVYESLEQSQNDKVIISLHERIKTDRSSIARMYAVSAILALIMKHCYSEDFIKKPKISFIEKKVKRVNLTHLATLYYTEQNIDYIKKKLTCFEDKDYHIRCNVTNLLSDVIDSKNIDMVKAAYRKKYAIEQTRAVKSLLE